MKSKVYKILFLFHIYFKTTRAFNIYYTVNNGLSLKKSSVAAIIEYSTKLN